MAGISRTQQAQVLAQLHIANASPRTTSTGVPQLISAAACNTAAINLGSSILLSDLTELTFEQTITPSSKATINGVAVSPCGNLVAAFTADAVYITQLSSPGQLQKATDIAGAKSIHWCPGSAALAILCKQADPVLLILPSKTDSKYTSQAPAAAAAVELHRLTSPLESTASARCATWLPHQPSSATTALLAAWPSELLLYSWRSTQQGSPPPDWHHPQVTRILPGWPGPVRTLAAAAAAADHHSSSSSSSCLVLGTVDAPLGLASHAAGQQQQRAKVGSISKVVTKSDGGLINPLISASDDHHDHDVLSSLMNIGSQPHHQRKAPVVISTSPVSDHHHDQDPGLIDNDHDDHHRGGGSLEPPVTASRAAASSQLNTASLCVMHIDLSDHETQQQHNGGSSSSRKTAAGSSTTYFGSVLPLIHHPLPNLLSVHQQYVAVSSSKGPPLVTLCSYSSQSGLSVLQTISVPMPAAAAAVGGGRDSSKVRLEGLLLAAAAAAGDDAQQQQQRVSLLPDMVALVSSSSAEQPVGHFASLSSSSSKEATAADMYLMKCRVPQQQQQQQQCPALPGMLSAAQNGGGQQEHDGQPAAAIPMLPSAGQQSLMKGSQTSGQKLTPAAAAGPLLCPVMHSSEQHHDQHQHLDAACSTTAGGFLQQQQLQVIQQQLDCILQQQALQSTASNERLDKLVEGLTGLESSVTTRDSSTQYLDATVSALSKMQTTLHCMMQTMQQQQQQQRRQQQPKVGAQTSDAGAEVPISATNDTGVATVAALHKMQATLEKVHVALTQQQQQQQPHAQPCSGDSQASSSTAAAFGTLQAAIERLTDTIIQQQQRQQEAIQTAHKQQAAIAAAGLANLQVSLETRLDKLLQVHHQQQQQQQAGGSSAVASALTSLQASLESKLDEMHLTLKDMVNRLAGLEEELAELEQN